MTEKQQKKRAKDATIGWNQMNKNKYFGYSVITFIGARTIVYPIVLVKTRIQVSHEAQKQNISQTIRSIRAKDGIRGLYRGYWTIAAGVIPSQAAYLAAIELGREYLKPVVRSYEARSFISGALASCASAAVGTPIDIVSQRLMVQSDSTLTDRTYKNGRDAFIKILRKNGISGLYRGFGAGILTYMPTSAIWWGSYSFYQHRLFYPLLEYLGLYDVSDHRKYSRHTWDLAVSAVAAVMAATSAVICTNPLDVARTRLQVQSHHKVPKAQQNFIPLMRSIVAEEGLYKFWTRGLNARLMSMIPVSTMLVLTFEITKKLSAHSEMHL